MTDYPNHQPKPAGCYVRNVHPCGHADEEGIVLRADAWPDYDGGTLTVATGIGGTTYGPACNWQPIPTRPEWMRRALELGNDRAAALLERVETMQEEALEAIPRGAAVIDLEPALLALAWPAARRHAVTLGDRHRVSYYLVGTILEQMHDGARRRADRAREAARAAARTRETV